MINGFDELQKFGKSNVDHALKSADAFSKGMQAVAAETADFTKKSFEAGSTAFERLLGAQSLDKAVEVQSDYLRTAYEGYVGQMTRVGEIVTDMTRDAYKPYEAMFAKFGK